jgi:hypothetical protein
VDDGAFESSLFCDFGVDVERVQVSVQPEEECLARKRSVFEDEIGLSFGRFGQIWYLSFSFCTESSHSADETASVDIKGHGLFIVFVFDVSFDLQMEEAVFACVHTIHKLHFQTVGDISFDSGVKHVDSLLRV